MESAGFFIELEKARVVLERAADYVALRGRGHQLVGGATLTCASEVPWQMQVKCSRCRGVFWFDNLAWRAGAADRWRLSPDSREHSTAGCPAKEITARRMFGVTARRISSQPVRG